MSSEKPSAPHVCDHCKDTHLMPLDGRYVPCTSCPTPCPKCRQGGRGAFCERTPCACECHVEGKLVIETEDRIGAEPPAHPLKLGRSARRSDTDHGEHVMAEKKGAHHVGPGLPRSDKTSDYMFVWGDSLEDIRSKARDRLLLQLGQAVLQLMNDRHLGHVGRDALGRAINEFHEAIR